MHFHTDRWRHPPQHTHTDTLTQADNNKRVREERYPPCRSRMCPDMEGLHTVMWPCSVSYVITSAATCSPWPKYDNWEHLPAENRKSVSSQRLDSAIMQLRSVRGHLIKKRLKGEFQFQHVLCKKPRSSCHSTSSGRVCWKQSCFARTVTKTKWNNLPSTAEKNGICFLGSADNIFYKNAAPRILKLKSYLVKKCLSIFLHSIFFIFFLLAMLFTRFFTIVTHDS